MMIKKLLAAGLTVCMLFALSGCQLAKENSDHKGAGKQNKRDSLIGVFVTTSDHSIPEECIYAKLVTKTITDEDTREYVFDGIQGIPFFSATIPYPEREGIYHSLGSDMSVCDRNTCISTVDEENTTTTIKGSIYMTPSVADQPYYFNPVYQNSDGDVYAVSGEGVFVPNEFFDGAAISQKLSETKTITENGKDKATTFSVDLSIYMMLPPTQIVVLQMDKDSKILSRAEYTPGKLPDTIKPAADTSYILVETHKLDIEGSTAVSYEVYTEKNETLLTFYCREDGICVQQYTQLDWGIQ